MKFIAPADIASLPVSTNIHPQDLMWSTGQPWYYTVGQSAIRVINLALGVAYFPEVRKILDLPCGHGRVGRYLRAAFPGAAITFCDLERSGADFCAENFGGRALYSEPDLATVDLGSGYDLIWVGSLFTHVDEQHTMAWLAHLAQSLSESGVLVATFHGAWAIEVLKPSNPIMIDAAMPAYERHGYGFAPYAGSEDYGLSISKPSKIVEMAMGIPGTRILSYMERAWADNHDVLAISGLDRLKPWK